MNAETRRRLIALNRAFYAARAHAFSETRDHAWPGWERVSAALPRRPAGEALRVLDVGCGNARLASHLDARPGAERIDYVGVDSSEALLDLARKRAGALARTRVSFAHAELPADAPGAALPAGPFDLVAAFGLLHHVPGQPAREVLMRALADRVAVGGVLAATAWRFTRTERLRARILPWPPADAPDGPGIDPRELEPGDHLLGFGAPGGPPRYCHACSDAEIEALREAASSRGLVALAPYDADGRSGDLNRYLLLRRPAADPEP